MNRIGFDPIRDAATEALRLPARLDAIWTELGRIDVRASDYPAITLRRSEAWARVMFMGGISLLRFPELAYGAECQLRGLLEYEALVGWVCGKASPGKIDGQCRALCIEVQDDLKLEAIASQSRPGLPSGYLAQLAGRRSSHESQLTKHGCKCGKFNASNVLEALAKSGAIHRQTPERWRLTSQLVHQGLSDRVLTQNAGVVGFIPAGPQYRGQLLVWLIRTYFAPATWILELDSGEAATRFKEVAIGIAENQQLTGALDGKFG